MSMKELGRAGGDVIGEKKLFFTRRPNAISSIKNIKEKKF